MKKVLKTIMHLPRQVVMLLIKGYQKTLSFDHGPLRKLYPNGFCRYHPTCSQYGYDAIKKYGVFKVGFMTAWRILRCNPWSKGGIDHVK
jgi:putative membrane protein insertion efficiency factor